MVQPQNIQLSAAIVPFGVISVQVRGGHAQSVRDSDENEPQYVVPKTTNSGAIGFPFDNGYWIPKTTGGWF
jgi:hypothetical protein